MSAGGEFVGVKILFFLIAMLACAGLEVVAQPIRVASLSTVMADLVRDIGAERVEVIEIVKPGTDPHIFEPSPGDYKTIANSRLLLASGLGFEGYLDKLRPVLEKSGVRLVVGGDVVEPIEGACEGHEHSEDHHHHGTADPHWWQSVSNVQLVARQIGNALIAIDPAGRVTYEKNAAALEARLEDLGKWVRLQIVQLPKKNRVLVTSHDALGYFAKEYGFEILPVQGISTSDQPSSQKVRDLIGRIRERGVKAIFAESIENPKVLGQITAETGAKPGGVIYADGLGSGDAGTYGGMMRHNVTTIVEALK
ncbi:MAG: metal ABC transporter solute-binding protein, Zn/Mn family [Terrimicrobiaceae bacterium]